MKNTSKKTKIISVIVVVVVVVVSLSLLATAAENATVVGSMQYKAVDGENLDKPVVIFENGDTITEEEVQLTMLMANVAAVENQKAISAMDISDAEKQALLAEITILSEEEALSLAIKEKVEFLEAEKLGLAPNDAEAKAVFEENYNAVKDLSLNGSEEEKVNALQVLENIAVFKKNAGITDAEYTARGMEAYKIIIARNNLREYYASSLPGSGNLTPEEFATAYDNFVYELEETAEYKIAE
ncbi:MAG TPA: hypothetical protein DEB31_10655 [Clostridiales bacterium]|nr:hypothetical protein [Clostridiales bacterium]